MNISGGSNKPLTFRSLPAKNVECDLIGGKKCTAVFHHQKFVFDFVPKTVADLFGEGTGEDDENQNLTVTFEVYEERMPILPLKCGCNRLLGILQIDLNRVFSNPFVPTQTTFPLKHPQYEIKGCININIYYEAGRRGMIVMKLIEGKVRWNLKTISI